MFRCPVSYAVGYITDKLQSIKNIERVRRGAGTKFLIGGSITKIPSDFKSFLLNSQNNKRFIQLFLSAWQTNAYAAALHGRQVLFVCEEQCVCLSSTEGNETVSSPIPELFSLQEEADTRIALHCQHACQQTSTDNNIIVRSPDTDVLVILISYAVFCLKKIIIN